MKHTEQRWMHIATGDLSKLDMSGQPGYQPCTVTWDVPEYEEVEVERWVVILESGVEQTIETKKDLEMQVITCQRHAGYTPTVVELKNTYRRRKPEPEPEVWETRILSRDCAPHRSSRLEVISDDEDLHGKKVRVEVVE